MKKLSCDEGEIRRGVGRDKRREASFSTTHGEDRSEAVIAARGTDVFLAAHADNKAASGR